MDARQIERPHRGVRVGPEAIAFAVIARVSPLTGLYAAIMMCLITAALGARRSARA